VSHDPHAGWHGNRRPVARARRRLAETDDQVKITHGGVLAAMLVSPQKWRSILETLDILADPEAVADIQEADAEAGAGGGTDLEEAAALVARRREVE
jgi:PHD/YefM family antitoxin component YafN of YafNO toxin-antitoxin module